MEYWVPTLVFFCVFFLPCSQFSVQRRCCPDFSGFLVNSKFPRRYCKPREFDKSVDTLVFIEGPQNIDQRTWKNCYYELFGITYV